MKTTLYLLGFLLGLNVAAQSALHNSGTIRIHGGGTIGFHTDLINNTAFDQNEGTAGFYDKEDGTANTISGAFAPVFYDTEISNDEGVQLEVGMDAINHTNFVAGNIITPRQQQDIYYNFLRDAYYSVYPDDLSRIDGYAAITDQQNFIFPVGDALQIRALTLNSTANNSFAKCAYYRASPASFPGLGQSFDPARKPRTMGTISNSEFWHLEGSVSSSIRIGWNANSNISALTNDVTALIAVGWSKSGQSWVNLGGTIDGDINQGFLISNNFVPNEYAVITFASVATPKEVLKLDNYLVTPNGDGVNDFLFIEELELSQDHIIRIFDRNGIKVYEEKNYINGFTGFANTNNMVIQRNTGLPNGIYFYIVDMLDLKLSFQGFLYLEK